jgi:hypothetical protein
MRLPQAKIKEALLRPEKLVGQEALYYFTDCYSQDAEVMPLAVKAIETLCCYTAAAPEPPTIPAG